MLLFVLTACGGGPTPCGGGARGSLAPLCSLPEPEPAVSPVGSWEGTLTTAVGGSGTEAFTATVTERGPTDYTGVFTVGDRTYNVSGFYSGKNSEGDAFVFQIPLAELGPTVSPAPNPGLAWSGQMTKSSFTGGWFLEDESGARPESGTFALERRP